MADFKWSKLELRKASTLRMEVSGGPVWGEKDPLVVKQLHPTSL
jgi:hypothetical protein